MNLKKTRVDMHVPDAGRRRDGAARVSTIVSSDLFSVCSHFGYGQTSPATKNAVPGRMARNGEWGRTKPVTQMGCKQSASADRICGMHLHTDLTRCMWSGHPDLNRGPPLPQSGALTGLRHVPKRNGDVTVENRLGRLPKPSLHSRRFIVKDPGKVSASRSPKTHHDSVIETSPTPPCGLTPCCVCRSRDFIVTARAQRPSG